MHMTIFLVVSCIFFSLLFLIWTSKDVPNFLIKAMFFFMAAWSVVELAFRIGIVIKL